MARAVDCKFDGQIISVEKALEMGRGNDYRCCECDKPVKPHKASRYGEAHFEHLRRNPKCSKSCPERQNSMDKMDTMDRMDTMDGVDLMDKGVIDGRS